MVYIDWTPGGNGGSATLDGVTKYAGSSSMKFTSQGGYFVNTITLTHNTFSSNKVQVICWARTSQYSVSYNIIKITHSSYGALIPTNSAMNTWDKFRVTFWYDNTTNTKWGRVERWDGTNWILLGGGDVNCGVGSPSAGTLSLELHYKGTSGSAYGYGWFDELEVYS